MYRQLPEKERSQSGTNDTKIDTNGTKVNLDSTKILNRIQENPFVTQAELVKELQMSLRTVKRLMADLQKRGLIVRQGSNRKGQWIIQNQKE